MTERKIIRKTTVAKAPGKKLEFILSDDTKDRMGDVIDPKGWLLDNFKKNPIALFGHQGNFPIGTWKNVRVEKNKLIGELVLAQMGTSPRIDELIRLVEQDVLRAVSVGFIPLEEELFKDNSGYLYKQQELLETSLVSVPANPSAMQLARSLNTSDEVIDLVFGEHASGREMVTRGANGELAELQSANALRRERGLPSLPKVNKMKTLAERIKDAQDHLTELKDQLTDHLSKIDETDDIDAATVVTDELSAKIGKQQKSLDSLIEAERQLATRSAEVVQKITDDAGVSTIRRPFATAAQKIRPGEHVMRTLVGMVVSHAARKSGNPMSIEEAIAQRYGEDGKIDQTTQLVARAMTRNEGLTPEDVLRSIGLTRAATAPADTTTSGWASQLVNTVFSDFVQLLIPQAVYPGLAARGLHMNFGRAGVISIPSRSATPTIAGSFVAQGAPIPVRQGAFAAVTLTPKKMAVISVFTREISEHSTPSIEALIREAIQEDTSVSLDTILLDATAASTTRPAGLRNGVTVTTATAGGGFAALVGDLKALIGALITASNGNLRKPVWIMNPIQALAISVTQNAGGDFPFAQEISQNRFQGYPVIQSATVTAGMVFVVDAADFIGVEGDAPRFDLSDHATLHLEDTTPLQIGTAGSPNTVAAPVRSLYQTDSMAIRMIMDINWSMRRTGVVAWTQSVTW